MDTKVDWIEMISRHGTGEAMAKLADANRAGRIQGDALAPPTTPYQEEPLKVATSLMWAHHDGYMSAI